MSNMLPGQHIMIQNEGKITLSFYYKYNCKGGNVSTSYDLKLILWKLLFFKYWPKHLFLFTLSMLCTAKSMMGSI